MKLTELVIAASIALGFGVSGCQSLPHEESDTKKILSQEYSSEATSAPRYSRVSYSTPESSDDHSLYDESSELFGWPAEIYRLPTITRLFGLNK